MVWCQPGFIVVTPDYEGTQPETRRRPRVGLQDAGWDPGGRDVAEAPVLHPVGVVGYSGGSIATEFASELAPRYAPELKLVGVAEGGIPVDLTPHLDYIDGSASWSG